jgi:hypothetical protein
MTRLGRSISLTRTRLDKRWRRSTKWLRARRHPRLAVPPATPVIAEKVDGGVFEIRLKGGQRRNVLGRSTIDRIEELVATPPHGTKVIVITAEPPDFCAGYDLVEASLGRAEELIAHESNFEALRTSVYPIVVALQGNVIGGGLELALSADIRLALPKPDSLFRRPSWASSIPKQEFVSWLILSEKVWLGQCSLADATSRRKRHSRLAS